jgi:hypothetical protein
VPSLDTADTTLALSTIDDSLNTGQRDAQDGDVSNKSSLPDNVGLRRNDWLQSGLEPLLKGQSETLRTPGGSRPSARS